MAYATVAEVQEWMSRTLSAAEQTRCGTLLNGAAAIIDAYASGAEANVKKYVSCQMVVRVLGSGDADPGVPIGASQGSMSALGYSQSWTIGGGSSGELYLSKTEKRMLGVGNSIGSYSPVQELVPEVVS